MESGHSDKEAAGALCVCAAQEKLDIISAFQAYGQYVTGQIDEDTRQGLVESSCPGPGAVCIARRASTTAVHSLLACPCFPPLPRSRHSSPFLACLRALRHHEAQIFPTRTALPPAPN